MPKPRNKKTAKRSNGAPTPSQVKRANRELAKTEKAIKELEEAGRERRTADTTPFHEADCPSCAARLHILVDDNKVTSITVPPTPSEPKATRLDSIGICPRCFEAHLECTCPTLPQT